MLSRLNNLWLFRNKNNLALTIGVLGGVTLTGVFFIK